MLLCLCLLGGAVGCRRGAGQSAPALDLRAIEARTPEARERLAIISVHAYVEKRRPELRDLMRNVEPLPIVDAAKTLASDDEPLAALRRKLAIVRLVAHARQEPDAVRAVEVLLGEESTGRLLERLDTRPSGGGAGGGAGGGETDASAPNPEIAVAESLETILAATGGASMLSSLGSCTSYAAWSHVGRPSGNDVSITIVAEAGQTLAMARQKLDPQSWHPCSTFWGETYLVEMNAAGQVVYEGGKPKRKPVPPAKGDSYTGERLYEKVACDGQCSLEVLLGLSTSLNAAGTSYLVQYGTPQHLSGVPVVVVDDGHVKATDGTPLVVESTKRLGFVDSGTADLVYALLVQIGVTTQLGQLVCCQ